ncbi:MAG: TPM domain-containing protein [Thermoanaerobaculia bacterium]
MGDDVKRRIAGVLVLLIPGLLGVLSASAAGGADAPFIFTALPPAPDPYVTDNAQLLSSEARARLTERLERLRETSAFVRVYLYTLRSANGAPPPDATQELYRRWRMRDRELWDGLATVFVFRDEKKALVMLGQGAPARSEEALVGVTSDLAAIFGDDPEGALSRVIDRIDKSLEGDTSSWIDSPPVPAEPSGPVHGNPPFADEGVTRGLEDAVRRASTPEHPIVLVLNPAKGLDSPDQRSGRLEKAWPGRILLACYTSDLSVTLAVPDALRDRFSDEQRSRLVQEIRAAMTNASYPRTLARIVGEIATLAEGRPLVPWVAWRHPLKTLGGGQDEDPAPLAAGIGIAAVLLVLVLWFLYTLVTNPMAIVAVVAEGVVEGLIGGLFGGGGGSGGGGFSGGGGSFGGGGASGSW